MENGEAKRFMSWKDVLITPSVEGTILVITLLFAWRIHVWLHLGFFGLVTTFYILMVSFTLLTLKIIRLLFPIREGIYSYSENNLTCYIWNLYGFLCITNLSLHYINGLIPPPFRKFFYVLLGAKMGRGIISIGGRLVDPHLITIEEMAMIGDDALLTPHAYARTSSDLLILGRIEVKKRAIIGAKSMIMPGVTIGENSMVNAMSLVTMDTKIPSNEVWGGNPAVKIKDLSNPKKD